MLSRGSTSGWQRCEFRDGVVAGSTHSGAGVPAHPTLVCVVSQGLAWALAPFPPLPMVGALSWVSGTECDIRQGQRPLNNAGS